MLLENPSTAARFAFRYASVLGLALIVFASAAVIGLYLIARASLFDAARHEVEELAQIAATLVDADAHRELRNPSQAGSALHLKLIAPLVKFHRATSDAIYVYTAITINKQVYYVLGTDYLYRVPGDDLPPDSIMERYDGSDPDIREALFKQIVTSNSKLQKEPVRSYLSGYAPFSSSSGFEGIVGVDIDAAKLEQRINNLNFGLLIVLAIIVLVAAVLASFIRVWRLRDLQNAILKKDLERAHDTSERSANVASLAAAVAHEFSQHLTVANGHLDLAQLQTFGPHKDLEQAKKALSLASDAVEQMRALASTSWSTLRRVPLQNVIDSAIQRLARRGMDVRRIQLLQQSDYFVRADQLRLEAAIGQLLRNALEASGKNEVQVSVVAAQSLDKNSWFDIFPTPNSAQALAIVIADTGNPISEATRLALGQPFFTTKGPGRGIGFAVVKNVALECGGGLWVGALPNGRENGNRFALILPIP
jgi:signal transduction histidine kinase